jgi:hypothetical protein
MDNKRRTSQKEIITTFTSGEGVEGVRKLLNRFPGAKLTFQKAISVIRERGRDVTKLEELYTNLYGAPREYVETYDDTTLGTAQQIASQLRIALNEIYLAAKKQNVQPEAYLRTVGEKGKGTALYNRDQFAEEYELYLRNKKAQFLESYDPEALVTSDDVFAMFDPRWELQKLHVSALVLMAGVKFVGKYRPPGVKVGAGKKLYPRDQMEAAVAGLRSMRDEVQNIGG